MFCSVCDREIKEFAFGPCNHKDMCSICLLHWKLLYNDNKCPTCKEDLNSLVVTTDGNKDYDAIKNGKETAYDEEYDIYFESEGLRKAYRDRLGMRCPICYKNFLADPKKSNPKFKTTKDLENHVKDVHQLILCDLCLKGLKVFPYEMKCYTDKEYFRHLNYGIQDPELDYVADPHPLCPFCKRRIFNEKELISHKEHSHQHCIFCPPEKNAYFKSRSELMAHYRKEHYVCDHPSCAGQEFSVFNTQLELMEHKLTVHNERERVNLADLFRDDAANKKKEPVITEEEIEQAKTFLVEDPSGWSREEIAKRSKKLNEELRRVFKGDAAKLDRYLKLSGEFVNGTVSAAVFHDTSLNLLGVKNLRVFSELISLLEDPVKRHVLETLFREAKGKRSSTLSKDYLMSIHALDVDSKKKPKIEANSGKKPVVSTMDAAWERAEEEEKKLEESGSETPMALTPEDREEEELADVVYPSMYPVAQPLQLQWKRFRAELNRLQELKSYLVDRKKSARASLLVPTANVALEIIRFIDEVLSERAKKESWSGIEAEKVANLGMVIHEQTDAQLSVIDWMPMFGVSERSMSEFGLFYDLFHTRDTLAIPPMKEINRGKRDLNEIPAKELNVLREAFVFIEKEAIARLAEITKDVEEERKKRFAAVRVPERPVRELTIGGLLPEKKKEKAWGGAMPKAPSFPSLSTIGSASINYAAIGKKEEKPRTSVSASPRDENALSNNAMLFPPLGDSPLESHLFAPPLPSQQKPAMPAGMSKFASWGARQPDVVERAFEKAMKEKEEGKKKGKRSRGVKLEF